MANFPTGVPPIEVVRAYWKLSWPACCNLKGQLPPKTLICLLHSLAALVSSQPTSCFAHEQPFSVANAGQPTSFSIGALYTSIGGTPCKNLPLSVVRIYYYVFWQQQAVLGETSTHTHTLPPHPLKTCNRLLYCIQKNWKHKSMHCAAKSILLLT